LHLDFRYIAVKSRDPGFTIDSLKIFTNHMQNFIHRMTELTMGICAMQMSAYVNCYGCDEGNNRNF